MQAEDTSPEFYLQDDMAFFNFCQEDVNSLLHFERDADGAVRQMPPVGNNNARINASILKELFFWNQARGEPGYVFESSAGFRFPNGAIRAPDASYVEKARYDLLSDEQQEHYAPLAPDFVIEVMSLSDHLTNLQAKMEEYMENGVRLGWLIDRKNRTVYVYRPQTMVQILIDISSISADPELPGFALLLDRIF